MSGPQCALCMHRYTHACTHPHTLASYYQWYRLKVAVIFQAIQNHSPWQNNCHLVSLFAGILITEERSYQDWHISHIIKQLCAWFNVSAHQTWKIPRSSRHLTTWCGEYKIPPTHEVPWFINHCTCKSIATMIPYDTIISTLCLSTYPPCPSDRRRRRWQVRLCWRWSTSRMSPPPSCCDSSSCSSSQCWRSAGSCQLQTKHTQSMCCLAVLHNSPEH